MMKKREKLSGQFSNLSWGNEILLVIFATAKWWM